MTSTFATPSHRLSLGLGLSLVLGLAACGDPPPTLPPVDPPPLTEHALPDEEAKAQFSAAYASYAAAREDGELSPAECEAAAGAFTEVYRANEGSMQIARFNAGAVWEACGELDRAVEIYTELEAQGFHLALNNLGVIEWERGNPTRALELFKRSVEADQVQAYVARNNLAAAHRDRYADKLSEGDFETAEHEIQNVLAVDTSNKAAYENLARLYYDRGRLKDASYLVLAHLVVTQALRVLDKEGERSADLWNLEGLLFMQDNNQVDALKAFKQAVTIEAKHPDANRNIGFIAIRFRDYARAEEAFSVALEDEAVQRDTEVYIAMGVAKRGRKDYTGAEDWYRKALEVDAADPRPRYNLAILNQDHLIGQEDVDQDQIKVFYNVAKEHCGTFETLAAPDKRFAVAVADCLDRVAIIDDALHTFDVMDEIEDRAAKIAAAAEAAELARRERLLKLEQDAMARGEPSPEELADQAEEEAWAREDASAASPD